MGISKSKKTMWENISSDDQERIVRMAWEDRSSFDMIQEQFGMSANEVPRFMRTQLDEKAYKRWRRRANTQGQLKHAQKRPEGFSRFKCSRQRLDGSTKGWK